ncbi:hypothetical protein JXA32_13900 [Candidatus Sumerlaeota bacterium]|nr:hypothetical protein [Candidatus Sumerlaeota bacterium]
MQLTLPDGTTQAAPDPEQVAALIDAFNPNQPSMIRLDRAEDDWLEIGIEAQGLKLRMQDPATRLVLVCGDTYLSKQSVTTLAKAYMDNRPKWSMSHQWAPEGKAGGAKGKKGGCLGMLLLAVSPGLIYLAGKLLM